VESEQPFSVAPRRETVMHAMTPVVAPMKMVPEELCRAAHVRCGEMRAEDLDASWIVV
jgi:hypothetical protein